MTDDTEDRIREALAMRAPPPEPFSFSVMSAHHRARERSRLMRRYAAIAFGAVALGLSAPVIAGILAHAPAAVSTGGIGLLLLAATVAWAFAMATPIRQGN